MIEAKNISMRYGSTVALDNVSFSAKDGEVLGLVGPNGAGKSTLMRILTTFICPTEGTAKIDGYDIREKPLEVRERVGYMPETVPLYVDMRVDEYLIFVGKTRDIKGKKLEERLGWLKKVCGIRDVWKHQINELSKGYRQRVGLAQALIHDPKIVILDEPTSGLDPLQIMGIRRLIKDLAKEKTVLFSTHILQEVEALADRTVIINCGKIISQGTKEELIRSAEKYRTYVLEVKKDKKDVNEALSGIYGVKDLKIKEEHENGFAVFEIKCSFEDDGVLEDINAVIAEKDWVVKKLAERAYSMEEIFISLLGKDRK
ncbi:MAG: ATP-binding cassette domain-containing protein [Candidatus Omnitrophota bacterium]